MFLHTDNSSVTIDSLRPSTATLHDCLSLCKGLYNQCSTTVDDPLSTIVYDPSRLSTTVQDPSRRSTTVHDPSRRSTTVHDSSRRSTTVHHPLRFSTTLHDPSGLSTTVNKNTLYVQLILSRYCFSSYSGKRRKNQEFATLEPQNDWKEFRKKNRVKLHRNTNPVTRTTASELVNSANFIIGSNADGQIF